MQEPQTNTNNENAQQPVQDYPYQAPSTAPPSPDLPRNSSKRLFLSATLFTIGVCVGIGGMLAYQSYTGSVKSADGSKLVDTPRSDIADKQESTDESADIYAGWKTYEQPGGTYTFKYPSSWTLTEEKTTNPYDREDTKEYEKLTLARNDETIVRMTYPFELIGGCETTEQNDLPFAFGEKGTIANFSPTCQGDEVYLMGFQYERPEQQKSEPLLFMVYSDSAEDRPDFTLFLKSFEGILAPVRI